MINYDLYLKASNPVSCVAQHWYGLAYCTMRWRQGFRWGTRGKTLVSLVLHFACSWASGSDSNTCESLTWRVTL